MSADPLGRRDAGLHRVHTVTRWALVGSAASALVLGLGYAHALPDLGSLLPTHASGGGGGGGGVTGTDGSGGSGSSGFGGVTAPQPGGQGGAHTSTGAS